MKTARIMTPHENHRTLDEITAGYLLDNPNSFLSDTSVMDLIQWHHEKVKDGTEPDQVLIPYKAHDKSIVIKMSDVEMVNQLMPASGKLFMLRNVFWKRYIHEELEIHLDPVDAYLVAKEKANDGKRDDTRITGQEVS